MEEGEGLSESNKDNLMREGVKLFCKLTWKDVLQFSSLQKLTISEMKIFNKLYFYIGQSNNFRLRPVTIRL